MSISLEYPNVHIVFAYIYVVLLPYFDITMTIPVLPPPDHCRFRDEPKPSPLSQRSHSAKPGGLFAAYGDARVSCAGRFVIGEWGSGLVGGVLF